MGIYIAIILQNNRSVSHSYSFPVRHILINDDDDDDNDEEEEENVQK